MPQARLFFAATNSSPRRRGFTGAQCLMALRALSESRLGVEHLESPRALLFFEKGALDASFSLGAPVSAAPSGNSLALSMPPGSSVSVATDLGLLHVKHSLGGQLAMAPHVNMDDLRAEAALLPPGMAAWLMLGLRTPSSDALAQSFFGTPSSSGSPLPATLEDVRSCMALVEATHPSNVQATMAGISGQWALISNSWAELTEIASAEFSASQASQCAQRIRQALSGHEAPVAAKPIAPKRPFA